MKRTSTRSYILGMLTLIVLLTALSSLSYANTVTVTDASGKLKEVPFAPESIICSGPGCLRLVTYLQAQNSIVAVDDMETGRLQFAARPYALANRQFRNYPVFGEFRGKDNPELIVGLQKMPQLILKTYPDSGYAPSELEKKTGIPVLTLDYGDLAGKRDILYSTLRTLGKVLDRQKRSEEVIAFFENSISDITSRTEGKIENSPTCFIGGIAHKGPHGIQSTEPAYPPFIYVNARNVAAIDGVTGSSPVQTTVSREKLIEWDPEVIFVDLSTLQAVPEINALYQLRESPVYQEMKAVRNANIYGVIPYNWYTQNFGSILADAYFAGKVLYPDEFKDIDPAEKADQIYEFLVGKQVFDELNSSFGNLVFKKIDLSELKSK